MFLDEEVTIKRFETRVLNGRKINVRAILQIDTKLYSNNNIEVISNIKNIDDIQVLNNNKTVKSLLGAGSTKVYAKDTINIDNIDDLAEIMKCDIRIINRDIKLSYNKVLAKADAQITIMYLTEDNRIRNITSTIPVMGFIDIENINDENTCDVNYKVRNIIIKPNNSDSHSIYVESEIEITCFAYETKDINLIEDLYSISSQLNFTPMQVNTITNRQSITDTCDIREQIMIPDMLNCDLYNVQTNPVIINQSIRNGKVFYEGEVNLELLYGLDNRVNTKNIQMPFKFEINSDCINENSQIDTSIEVKRDDFVINNENFEANIELSFNLSISQQERLNIINEISVEENTENNIYSMVIYFVKPGDTLWKIAKKFKSTIEDIARVNSIEDANMIYVGQQLYIPKYVNKNIAV